MTSNECALELQRVSKSFGSQPVLQQLSLSLNFGETVVLLGANGAGKSTMLRVAAGLSRADKGSVKVAPSGRVSLFSHHLFLYPRLTVRENLRLFASLVGVTASVEDSIVRWGLESLGSKVVSTLSKGNQARVALARACLAPSPVLLLDEPTSNLDERGTSAVRTAVRESRDSQGRKSLVVIATHDLHRLGDLASRVVVLSQGQVVADSGPQASVAERDRIVQIYRESNR